MANINNKPVSVKLDRLYFDRVFEPERKKLSQKLGTNFTQKQYTAYLARKKLKIRPLKNKRTFSPRGFI